MPKIKPEKIESTLNRLKQKIKVFAEFKAQYEQKKKVWEEEKARERSESSREQDPKKSDGGSNAEVHEQQKKAESRRKEQVEQRKRYEKLRKELKVVHDEALKWYKELKEALQHARGDVRTLKNRSRQLKHDKRVLDPAIKAAQKEVARLDRYLKQFSPLLKSSEKLLSNKNGWQSALSHSTGTGLLSDEHLVYSRNSDFELFLEERLSASFETEPESILTNSLRKKSWLSHDGPSFTDQLRCAMCGKPRESRYGYQYRRQVPHYDYRSKGLYKPVNLGSGMSHPGINMMSTYGNSGEVKDMLGSTIGKIGPNNEIRNQVGQHVGTLDNWYGQNALSIPGGIQHQVKVDGSIRHPSNPIGMNQNQILGNSPLSSSTSNTLFSMSGMMNQMGSHQMGSGMYQPPSMNLF